MNVVNIDLLFKIAGIGIFISMLNIVLKQAEKEEQAQMLTLVGVVIVLLMVLQLINELFQASKPSSIFFSRVSNSRPDRIIPAAQPGFSLTED